MIAFIKKLWRDRRGNALIIAGLSLPIVVGGAGLAVDTIQWTMWKRQLQRAADSAAFAGVYAKVENNANMTAAQAVTGDLLKHNSTGITLLSSYPQVAYPTGTGYTNAVQVTLAIQKTLGFSSLFMSTAPVITTTGTAALFDDGNYCVVALAPTGSALIIGGSADVDMGCGAISNSGDPVAAVSTNGTAYNFEADPVAAVGGMPTSINGASELQPFHIAMQDPYANLPMAIPSGMSCTNFNTHRVDTGSNDVDGDGRVDITAGCYSTFTPGNDTYELEAGTYYFDSIDLSLAGQTRLVGTGVTIILTGTTPGSLTMAGNSAMDLTAPTSGTYTNMLIMQSPNAATGNNNTINGDNNTALDGAIYFPRGDITFSGSAATATQCAMVVAYTVEFTGSTTLQNDTSTCDADTTVQGKKVRLIA